MTITWNQVLQPRRCNANLRNFAKSGGRTLSGREPRSVSDAGYWLVAMGEIAVTSIEEARAYRALIARLRQGEEVLVPVFDVYTPRGAASSAAAITVAANTPLRATQVPLTATEVDIQAGHHFTIGDRLHLVTEVVSGPVAPPFLNPVATDTAFMDDEPWTDVVAGSSAYVAKILPPLRAAVAGGQAVSFQNLMVRCVLQDLADGDLDLDLGRFGTPSITFIESI